MNKGFTLVELLVAATVFIFISAAAIGILIFTLRAQRKTLATQELLSQTSYVVEFMSRSLRMARKQTTQNCLSQNGLNYENPDGNVSQIRFINYEEDADGNDCYQFFLQGEQLMVARATNWGNLSNPNNIFALTSNLFKVLDFRTGPSDSWDQNDDEQPRVTLFFRLKRKGSGQQPEITIQTTISQRNLDTESL